VGEIEEGADVAVVEEADAVVDALDVDHAAAERG
jgi:hypothetical protein